jgi:hypothetical protein
MADVATPRFRRAVWLAPAAYTIHVSEEWGRFPDWVRAHLAPGFADTSFVLVNAIAMTVLLSFTAAVSRSPSPQTTFRFFVWIDFQIFWNALVHIAATIYLAEYSPGTISALLVYLPVWTLLSRLASRADLLPRTAARRALALGAMLHAALGTALVGGAFSR